MVYGRRCACAAGCQGHARRCGVEEQYFITRTIILYIGAALVVLLLAGYGIVSLSERMRRRRERKRLEKSLRKNGTKR